MSYIGGDIGIRKNTIYLNVYLDKNNFFLHLKVNIHTYKNYTKYYEIYTIKPIFWLFLLFLKSFLVHHNLPGEFCTCHLNVSIAW